MDAWWPRAIRDAGTPASGEYVDSRFKGVLHTTEGSSYRSARTAFAAKEDWPHFTVSFESGAFQAWQHIPLSQPARALLHKGAVETNRARAIQIEIVGFATEAARLAPAYLQGIAQLMRWIEAETGIERMAPPFKPYPASWGVQNGLRMDARRWLAFHGWCGHQHVPENDHGDPGAIPMKRLLGAAPAPAPEGPIQTGVDRAGAPSVDEAKAIHAAHGASWWGVYIGGPCSAGSGWTPARVRELAAAGFQFLPIYVGRQSPRICRHAELTAAQGQVDGAETIRLLRAFGWESEVPVCLDVEAGTFHERPEASLQYVGGWIRAVRQAGARPGVYSSPLCLGALAKRPQAQRPDFVWVASWLNADHVNPTLDPRDAHGLPRALWKGRQRAWQYLGDRKLAGARSPVDVSCSNVALAAGPRSGSRGRGRER